MSTEAAASVRIDRLKQNLEKMISSSARAGDGNRGPRAITVAAVSFSYVAYSSAGLALAEDESAGLGRIDDSGAVAADEGGRVM